MTWNPLAPSDVQTFPLECSRDDDGVPQAHATFRPWSGRERLAYDDAVIASLLGKTDDGSATFRMGALTAVAISLSLVSVDGFPDELELEREVDGETRVVREPLNLRDRAHLERMAPEVVTELGQLARRVQPLPGFAPVEAERDDQDGEGEQGEDPSPTPSTPPGEGDASVLLLEAASSPPRKRTRAAAP